MMHFRLFAILLLLVAGSTTVVSGQTQQEPALDMEFTDIPLSEAISRIEKNTRYTFFYDAKQTDLSQRVSLKAKRMPISAALKEMLAPTGLNFTITERQIALIPARKAAARQRTIAGVVNDSSETPLAGVAVTLVGDNTRGAVTEANGSFSLTVPDADITLNFTYLGYVSKKVAVPATQNNVKVFLTEDAVKMEDVVVVGYGTQKKVNLTGAIATVDEKQLQNRSAPSVAHMLQGSVPGLTVSTSSGRPGNPASLNIRGITSINGGSPLVLVDGAEGDLMKINPNDVASISVVKDASAAAIYGARAAFGVVLVTTKSGDSSGKTRISYSGRKISDRGSYHDGRDCRADGALSEIRRLPRWKSVGRKAECFRSSRKCSRFYGRTHQSSLHCDPDDVRSDRKTDFQPSSERTDLRRYPI